MSVVKEILFTVIIILFCVGLVLGFGLIVQHQSQSSRMQNSLDCMINYGKAGRPAVFIESLSATDFWGNQMKLSYEVTKEYHKATVTSMGRDGKPDTSDDWKLEKFDYNKSYQIGKLATEKAKEALDGIMDGIKEKGKFEEVEPTK